MCPTRAYTSLLVVSWQRTLTLLFPSQTNGNGGGFSAASSTFDSVEGIWSSFRFLEIVAFSSGAVFAFFRAFFHLLLRTGQLACLGCGQPFFLFTPRPLCQTSHNLGIRSSMHPLPGSAFVSVGYRRQQSLAGPPSYNCQESHCTWSRSFPVIHCMVF
jgi:hypothetical protein